MTDNLEQIMQRIDLHILHTSADHWHWAGPTDNTGYACISIAGRTERVHRILWQHRHGQLDQRERLWNHCRHRACVNPDHWDLTWPQAYVRIGITLG